MHSISFGEANPAPFPSARRRRWLKRFNPFSRHDWEKAGDKIEDAAEQVGDAFKDTAEDAGKKLQPLAEQAFDAAEEAVKKALQHLVAVAAKGTLNKAIDLIQILPPDSLKLKVLAVFIIIDDTEERINTLQRWANNPPTSKKALKRMIRDLKPTACGIEADLQAALLIVSSDAIEVGFSATWNTDRFLRRFDDLIKGF